MKIFNEDGNLIPNEKINKCLHQIGDAIRTLLESRLPPIEMRALCDIIHTTVQINIHNANVLNGYYDKLDYI